ncbi:ABC transporter permease [Celeribacter baekdonensis]|uniref:ABC transporter permease n=1 Tax=Celeribacter baekdonensis TaxID=875171 RepID=UPI0030DAE514|tara:strand:- start:83335 stop:83796 length:462 start_codon:yes stop_codon:yes gene_type:complete
MNLFTVAFGPSSNPTPIVQYQLCRQSCNFCQLGVVLSAKGQPWAEAVTTLGVNPFRLYLRHILPNVAGILIVQLTLNFPQIILLESALSFLGLGVQPPMTSLGQIMGDGRNYLSTAWWISVLPGAAIFFISRAMCVLGDWLRDHLDPALQRQR